jgi:hypothetical protein
MKLIPQIALHNEGLELNKTKSLMLKELIKGYVLTMPKG